MNRTNRIVFAGCAVLALAIFLLAQTLVVKVQQAHIKDQPKFYARTLVVLKAGDAVEKVKEEAGWYNVKTAQGVVGWLHSSAVESRGFNLMTVGQPLKAQASADEVALASKGFNKQVEDSYRASTGISYEWVDKMLQIKVSDSSLLEFLKSGRLGEFGGSR